MKLYELLNFVTLWTIAIISALIAYEFQKSVDGKLRIIIRNLFISKIWVYGGAAIFYTIFNPVDFVYIRLILITPMAVIMLQLWDYMRKRK